MMPIALDKLTDAIYKYWAAMNSAGTTGGLLQNPPIAYIQACLAPLIILYLVAQKTFVESLTQTGIKM